MTKDIDIVERLGVAVKDALEVIDDPVIHAELFKKHHEAAAEIERLRNPWVPIVDALPPECLDGRYVVFGLIVDAGRGEEWELSTGRMCQSGNAAGTWQYIQGSMNGNTTEAIISWYSHYQIPLPPKGPSHE